VLRLAAAEVRKGRQAATAPRRAARRPRAQSDNESARRRLTRAPSRRAPASAMLRASTSKNARRAARVSLRPKPSVPSATYLRGDVRPDEVGHCAHVVARGDGPALSWA
jgi:hypothetical protein